MINKRLNNRDQLKRIKVKLIVVQRKDSIKIYYKKTTVINILIQSMIKIHFKIIIIYLMSTIMLKKILNLQKIFVMIIMPQRINRVLRETKVKVITKLKI